MTELEYLKRYCAEQDLEEGIRRLENGEPVQYIVGNVNFYGYELKVTKDVLIPRFETEELIDLVLKKIKQKMHHPVSVVDIGTGSGCIAIAIKKELPSANVTAVDISDAALVVAKENAKQLDAEITFLKGDLLEPLTQKYDVLISNPPYIAYDEEIEKIVKENEPHLALYADHHGLYCYEEILKNAPSYLSFPFIMAFEIGQTQGEQLKHLARIYYPEASIQIEKDLQGLDRFCIIELG